MKLKLYFNLENENFPIQYRKSILSFIKKSLTEYSEEYYKKLYNERDNIIKPYTFAIFFNNPEFRENQIIIKDKKFQMNMSIADMEIAVALYNSFNHQKQQKFSLNSNSWKLENISLINEKKIETGNINIKFMSPLVVRNRQNQKDYYYSYGSQEFLDTLKINIKEQLKITNMPENIVDTFEIKSDNYKKVIVKFYEKKIESTLGSFNIKGDIDLLRYLYQAGVGSKRSSGFGMFEIID
jgi:CRISPR-associated endoribonuclease Cas6